VEQLVGDRRVECQDAERLAAGRLPSDLHAGDVDPCLAEALAIYRDDAGAVGVEHHDVVLLDRQLDRVLVDADELLRLLGTGESPRDGEL
ncbi:hypothetical protein ABE10_00630, partial [Bacillus toyonensis]|nr:hypothetical protein [Bacillus toyonensis]